MNTSREHELLVEGLYNAYSDLAYLLIEKKFLQKAALVAGACIGPNCSPPANNSTDLKTSIEKYDSSDLGKERDAKAAAIAKRDKGETPEQQKKRYGAGSDGSPLSREQHLESVRLFKKSQALRARGPR